MTILATLIAALKKFKGNLLGAREDILIASETVIITSIMV